MLVKCFENGKNETFVLIFIEMKKINNICDVCENHTVQVKYITNWLHEELQEKLCRDAIGCKRDSFGEVQVMEELVRRKWQIRTKGEDE